MSDLELLTNFLSQEYNIDILFDKDEEDAYYHDVKCIGICTRHSKEVQLFCLLHEAGHFLIRRRRNFPIKYRDTDSNKKTSKTVDVIREEINAWEEGERLAKKLRITLDEGRWTSYWKKQVYEYILWGAETKKV